MNKLADYLYQCLKLPIIAMVLAGGAVMLADPFVGFSLIEKILVFAGVFTVLLTVKNHFAQVKLLGEMRQHLDGISEFERDVSKRLDEVSIKVEDTEFLSAVSKRVGRLEKQIDASGQQIDAEANAQSKNENLLPENIFPDPKIIPISNAANQNPSNLPAYMADGQLQMYLQPVLTLPDRDVTHYEAFARLDMGNNKVIKCRDFLVEAKQSGAIVDIDRQMLLKIVRLLRELRRNNVAPGVFWNLSSASLADKEFFNDVLEILKANSIICPQILVEISLDEYQKLGSKKLRKLSSLRDLGVGLSIDQCDDLALLQKVIGSSAFSFVKIPITTLVGYEGDNHEVNGVRIAHQANDNGTRLIATHVEKEFQVMELIDQDIMMGQGHLFSEPRPAKSRDNNSVPQAGSIAST